MKMDELPNPRSGSGSFGFLRNRRFLLSMSIMFFYLCVEASVMGWMVTYYADSGAVAVESAQLLTSMLWVVILAGRFICGALSGRIAPPRMILALCGGILVFLAVLLMSAGLIPMLAGTVGLGPALSGMYGTTAANAGSVFGEYPLAMGGCYDFQPWLRYYAVLDWRHCVSCGDSDGHGGASGSGGVRTGCMELAGIFAGNGKSSP